MVKNFTATTDLIISNNVDDKNEFSEDPCKALIKVNIPLNKLENEALKTFLKKYTGKHIHHESTLRKDYVDPLYEKTLENIMTEIIDSPVWLSVGETGRYMVHVKVGKLSADEAGRGQITVLQSAFGCFTLFHLTCLAHGIHRVAEEVRAALPEINSVISSAEKVFIKAPSRVRAFKTAHRDCPLPPEPALTGWGTWISAANYHADNLRKVEEVLKGFEDSKNLAITKSKDALKSSSVLHSLSFIPAHFGGLPDLTEKHETRNVEAMKAVALVEGLRTQSKSRPGPISERLRRKLDAVLHRNPGCPTIRKIAQLLEGKKRSENLDDFTSSDVAALKFLRVVSCDVEQ
ncbi:uncharacterized protein LOC126209945 [Schistocerca nitens]|uniref:uncharacterized protein LOC126209945 n=1 Tax=Schistocerca nitens TaxID=7011 RepID=UPI0021191EA9|nr:uncharacterized protein LOC126209945 [Schistocerca nitens]